MERETFWGGALERRVYLREGWLERGANLIGEFIGGRGSLEKWAQWRRRVNLLHFIIDYSILLFTLVSEHCSGKCS